MKRKEFYLIFIFTAFSSCLQSPEMTTGIVNGKEEPTVVTGQISPFTDGDGNLVFQGEITSKGKSDIIEKGFYWSTVSNDPGINDSIVVLSDTSSGIFTYELQRASGEQTYYWRAYAKNSFGCDSGKVQSCQTPVIWGAEQDFPPDSQGGGAIFLLNNRIYMACGLKNLGNGVFVDKTWEYNTTSNQWSQADSISFPGANRSYPVVFTIGNLAFVGTGRQAATLACNDFYQFDADSRRWTEIATPDNLEARYGAAAFSLSGNGYVIGGSSFVGYSSIPLNDVWQYNPNQDSWEKKNDFPVNFSGGISISDNNRAFVGFGDVAESNRTLWEYIPTTDSWNEFAQLPDKEVTKIYSGVIVQNTIYIVDENNSIWALNMSDTTWTQKSDLPSEFLIESNGEGGNQNLITSGNSNTIYVGLGFSKLLYQYNPLWDN